MNSLEFIDKEIEFLEDMISIDLSLVEDDFDLQEIYKKQQKLRLLKQIKTEVEAWYVLKNSKSYVMFNRDIDTKKLSIKYTFITDSENEEILEKALRNRSEQ